jgi:hypothetical protein
VNPGGSLVTSKMQAGAAKKVRLNGVVNTSVLYLATIMLYSGCGTVSVVLSTSNGRLAVYKVFPVGNIRRNVNVYVEATAGAVSIVAVKKPNNMELNKVLFMFLFSIKVTYFPIIKAFLSFFFRKKLN